MSFQMVSTCKNRMVTKDFSAIDAVRMCKILSAGSGSRWSGRSRLDALIDDHPPIDPTADVFAFCRL